MDRYSICRMPDESQFSEEWSDDDDFMNLMYVEPTKDTPLCQDCQRLNVEALEPTTKKYTRGPLLRWSCPLCYFLYNTFRGYLNPDAEGYRLFYQPGELHDFPHLAAQESIENPSAIVELHHVLISTHKGSIHRITCYFPMLKSKGDPAETCGIPVWPAMDGRTTRSEESAAFVRRCIGHCDANHACLKIRKPDGSAQVGRPARLLDTKATRRYHGEQVLCTKLVEPNWEAEHPTYITLSHCWGGNLTEKEITTNSNKQKRLSVVAYRDLPLNFRNAISITRSLGFRYLWIDALCIIQRDDEDWKREAPKMADIYQNSALTIAASLSYDSHGGCYNNYSQAQPIKATWASVKSKLSDGQTSFLSFRRLHAFRPSVLEPLPLANSPLASRGWIFQERRLSPRTIHYTSSQLVWECCKFYQTEDNLSFPVHERPTVASKLLSFSESAENDLDMLWYTDLIGKDFAFRLFTKYQDRLIAVSGIAKLLKSATNRDYVAGIWSSSLAYGLTWEVVRHRHPSAAPPLRNTAPRRPTWSWAAHDFHFTWTRTPKEFIASKELVVNDIRLQYSGHNSDEFSPVDYGSLVVTGLVTKFYVSRQWKPCWSGTYFADTLLDDSRDDYLSRFDYDGLEENPILAWLQEQSVPITGLLLGEYDGCGPYFLLLNPLRKDPNRFTRLGSAMAVKGDQSKFIAGLSKKTIEIT